MVFKRILNIALPPGQSTFLWGARKTGKTTFLRRNFSDSVYYDFLKTDLFVEFSKKPALLREELLAMPPKKLNKPIILDEVQKVPMLLDEVHWLIENKRLNFILCGSSARKLKRGHGNLLGGRAWRCQMLPLTTLEIEKFNLLKALNNGLIPSHYLQKNCKKSLKAYVVDYLKEEIFAEGLTRNIAAFSNFLDTVGYSHGELINYSNISRECGVDAKSIKEYFQILQDTMLGCLIYPFKKRQERQVITKAPKFYLFDVGVAGFLSKRTIEEEKGAEFGKAFEHFILMEILAYRAYKDLDFRVDFWRTKTGQEVDFILGNGEVAVEVKGNKKVDNTDLKHLKSFSETYSPKKSFIVCNEKRKRLCGKTEIIPYKLFLENLWSEKIIT